MTPEQFRKIALSQPDTIESQHMGHPDFRVGGKIFASLGKPSDEWAMVKLTSEQQTAFCEADAVAFQPCKGDWGRQGCTNVKLADVRASAVKSAIGLAIENVSSTKSTRKPRGSATEKQANVADSQAVSSMLRDLEHPLKSVIENIRSAILKSDPQITEGIKWNAPSFYCDGWFATFHLRAKSGVLLVLHHGAKVRKAGTQNVAIADPTELLTWASEDRATILFTDAGDFKRKQSAFKAIIKQWVRIT